MRRKLNTLDSNFYSKREICGNPWTQNCEKRNITIYITYQNEKKPICRSCWKEISNSEYEW